MCALQTSMSRTAAAKAAVAGRIGLSAIPADMPAAVLLHAEYQLETGLVFNRGGTQGLGSEGVTVK